MIVTPLTWKQDENGDAHAVDNMEEHAEQEEDLEERTDVNIVDDVTDLPAPSFQKCSEDMCGDKDRHPQAANAMQDVGQERTLSLVPQSRIKADIPFQAHRNLRNEMVLLIISCTSRYFTPLIPKLPVLNKHKLKPPPRRRFIGDSCAADGAGSVEVKSPHLCEWRNHENIQWT